MSAGIVMMGLVVGFFVGLTGVGAASLLTPLLIMMGLHPSVAVGSDLLYNSVTKLFGTIQHWRQRTIDWRIVGYLAAGSIPGAVGAIACLYLFETFFDNQETIIKLALGYVLIMVAFITLVKVFFDRQIKPNKWQRKLPQQKKRMTAVIGFVLGIIVGLTSIGSGSLFGLFMLYFYSMNGSRLVGTDIAHAFFLVSVAGLLHAGIGNIDYMLVMNLLAGSVPGVIIGSKLSIKAPTKVLRAVIASLILISGLKII